MRPEVPDALDRAIRVALHVDPAQRYASALEMAEAVAAGARGEDTEATMRLAATAPTRTTSRPRRRCRAPSTRAARPDDGRADPRARARSRARAAPRRASAGGRRKRQNRAGRFLVALLLLAAGAVAAFAAVSAMDGGGIDAPSETRRAAARSRS